MKRFSWDQRKGLADFTNTVAAAWFTAGIITPFFTKPKSPIELLSLFLGGIGMTVVMLYFSLLFLERK